MSDKKKKLPGSYYSALVKALRPLANGFSAADGYDLRNGGENLTRGQRAKISRYANEVRELTARENYLFRGRNKEHLKIAQEVAQHSPGFPGIKVAFVPWTKPLGSKARRPDLHFKKDTLVISTSNYDKHFAPFNKKKIINDADLEIARTLAQLPPRATLQIQTGKYVIGQTFDAGTITREILKLMEKYDGKKQKLGTHNIKSKNKKIGKPWNPKHHDSRQWLNGIVAFKFKAGGQGNNDKRLLQAQQKAREDHRRWKKKAASVTRAKKVAKRSK